MEAITGRLVVGLQPVRECLRVRGVDVSRLALTTGENPKLAALERFALDPDIGGAGIGETPSITSSIAITVSNKSHFAVVYDFPRGVARLYVNGQRAGTGTAAVSLGPEV